MFCLTKKEHKLTEQPHIWLALIFTAVTGGKPFAMVVYLVS